MTEKEFRKLVSDVEVSRHQKDEMGEIIDTIHHILSDNNNLHYEIVNIYRGGSLAKGTMLNSSFDLDIILVVKPTINKTFGLVNKVVLNEIFNAIVINVNNINKVSDLACENNILSFKYNNYNIKLLVKYNDESIEDLPHSLLERIEQIRYRFVEIANRDYTYFKNTIQIIKYYRDEQKITSISGTILEVILYYALKEYCFALRYEDYLNAFVRGLDDFIMGKKIEVPISMYNELGIIPATDVKKNYSVIDPGTGSINLTSDITEIKLGDYRKLKKAIAKLVDTKSSKEVGSAEVKLNVTPNKNEDGTYSWCFKIEDTSFMGMGGKYTSSNEDTYTAIYKALLKGFKAIVDNNLNRKGVKIICSKNNILEDNQDLSNENNARRKNVLAFIDNNNITISK
ncbi:MAG: hypothetical protein ACI32E_00280 [Bacilli bacterium]